MPADPRLVPCDPRTSSDSEKPRLGHSRSLGCVRLLCLVSKSRRNPVYNVTRILAEGAAAVPCLGAVEVKMKEGAPDLGCPTWVSARVLARRHQPGEGAQVSCVYSRQDSKYFVGACACACACMRHCTLSMPQVPSRIIRGPALPSTSTKYFRLHIRLHSHKVCHISHLRFTTTHRAKSSVAIRRCFSLQTSVGCMRVPDSRVSQVTRAVAVTVTVTVHHRYFCPRRCCPSTLLLPTPLLSITATSAHAVRRIADQEQGSQGSKEGRGTQAGIAEN